MGNVISIAERKRKRGNKSNSDNKKSKIVTEKTTTKCPSVLNSLKKGSSTDVGYAELEPNEQIAYWEKIEKEEDERFKTKYKDVLTVVPVTAGAKMQYFATVMLRLLPDIFHGGWDTRFDTWMDFCEFYISEFDPAYSDYLNSNKEFEKIYSYKFKPISEKKLEEELKDCLTKIVELYPEKHEDTTEILYQVAKLFELEEILSDLFYKEIIKEQ